MGKRIVNVDPKYLIFLLDLQHGEHPEFIRLAVNPELPVDVRVLQVHYDWSREVFQLMLLSDSWTPVDEGAEIPEIGTGEFVIYSNTEYRRME